MGLNNSFTHIRSQLLLTAPIPSINKVFSLIIQEERQRSILSSQSFKGVDTVNNMAFMIRNDTNKKPSFTSSAGHRTQRKDRPLCTHCNLHGHTVGKCYKLHGYPPSYRHKLRSNTASVNQTSVALTTPNTPDNIQPSQGPATSSSNVLQGISNQQYQQLMTLLSPHFSSQIKDTPPESTTSSTYTSGICLSISMNDTFSSVHYWILDSGASRHICSNLKAFINLRPVQNSNVILPNNTSLAVHLCGDVIISSQLTLRDVPFVPHFQVNLLSVSALTGRSPLVVTFTEHNFLIQDSTNLKTIGRGNKHQDLYILDVATSLPIAALQQNVHSVLVNAVSAQTWQKRVGHLSSKAFDLLKPQLHFHSSNYNNSDPYYICPLAKQRRLPFVSHNNMSQQPFELIHCDILGPYHVPAYSGHRFFLTLVDDTHDLLRYFC